MKIRIMGLIIFLTTVVFTVVCRKNLEAHLNELSGSQMLADILIIQHEQPPLDEFESCIELNSVSLLNFLPSASY
jgi:hypothetical protein